MRVVITAGGFPTFVSGEEYEFVEQCSKNVYKETLTERQAEIAKMLTSRGVLQRFNDEKGIYYTRNQNKNV